VSFASLNGADKEVDNINPIKKVTLSNGHELPYVSSQAIRRALRDRLGEMGHKLSPVQEASAKKGAPKTMIQPSEFIDDDLFGYMDAAPSKEEKGKGTSSVRTSPIRVESLVALSEYKGDLDYATNYMGKSVNADPNIFETEIHSGIYRGTILIELDRIGSGQGFEKGVSDNVKNKERVLAFLNAFRNLWSSGRQTRFLADISPKFIAAACMRVKNPIFLEAVNVTPDGNIQYEKLTSVVTDYEPFIVQHVFAKQDAVFPLANNVPDLTITSLKDGFSAIEKWIEDYYSTTKAS
jgi:CRISPR-associated protein Cst2